MNIEKLADTDLYIIKPKIFNDERGYFFESFKENTFKNQFPKIKFVQENESMSSFGTLRGLHFQNPPFAQTKLVRVIYGEILDVVVDLRLSSPKYGKHQSVVLSYKNKYQLLVPKGYAHGFVVNSDFAIVNYKVDSNYSPNCESGLLWNDSSLMIDWKIDLNKIKVSEKDRNLPKFDNLKSPFK